MNPTTALAALAMWGGGYGIGYRSSHGPVVKCGLPECDNGTRHRGGYCCPEHKLVAWRRERLAQPGNLARVRDAIRHAEILYCPPLRDIPEPADADAEAWFDRLRAAARFSVDHGCRTDTCVRELKRYRFEHPTIPETKKEPPHGYV